MVLLMERSKLFVEGAGAVGVAALMAGRVAPARTGTTCVVLSGGNVDLGVLPGLIRRHETTAGRRLIVFARISDRPGGLAKLLTIFAERGREPDRGRARPRRRRPPGPRDRRPSRARGEEPDARGGGRHRRRAPPATTSPRSPTADPWRPRSWLRVEELSARPSCSTLISLCRRRVDTGATEWGGDERCTCRPRRRDGSARRPTGIRGPLFGGGQGYFRAIERAGGVPLHAAADPGPRRSASTRSLDRVDALVLHGGGDVDPRRYGEEPSAEQLYGIVPDHDEVELAVVRAALARDLPILAICRGMQVAQRRPRRHARAAHRQRGPLDARSTPSTSNAGSKLAKAIGGSTVDRCHSVHHQCIARLGDGLRCVGAGPRRHAGGDGARRRRAGSSPCSGTPRTPPRRTRSSRRCSTSSSARQLPDEHRR